MKRPKFCLLCLNSKNATQEDLENLYCGFDIQEVLWCRLSEHVDMKSLENAPNPPLFDLQ